MTTETEAAEKKTRKVTPRTATHQAALDAVHAWLKVPFKVQREEMMKALLDHKRYMHGDDTLTTL